MDFGASTTEGSLYNLVLKAGGELIFIHCQASVCLQEQKATITTNPSLTFISHPLDAPSKLSCIFGKAFDEDSMSSHNCRQPGV